MNYTKQTKAQLIDHIHSFTEEREATPVRYLIVFLAGMLLMYAFLRG